MGTGLTIFRWQLAGFWDSIVQQRSMAGLAGGQFEWRAYSDMILITLGKGSLVEVVRFVGNPVAGQSTIYFMLAEVSLYSSVNENTMLIFKLPNSVYFESSQFTGI